MQMLRGLCACGAAASRVDIQLVTCWQEQCMRQLQTAAARDDSAEKDLSSGGLNPAGRPEVPFSRRAATLTRV